MGPKKKAAGAKASATTSGSSNASKTADATTTAPSSKNAGDKKAKTKGKDKIAEAPNPESSTEKKPKTAKQIVGGDSWTGKTPQTLLYELSVKKSWKTPFYTMKPAKGGGGFVSSVILKYENPKTKEMEEVIFIPPTDSESLPTSMPTALEARNYAACYGLHRVSEGRNMTLMLPPAYRDYWAIFETQRKQDVAAKMKYNRYSADPFLVQREKKADEAERQKLREKQQKDAASQGTTTIHMKSSGGQSNNGGNSGRGGGRGGGNWPTVELSRSARTGVESLIKKHHIWNPSRIRMTDVEKKKVIDKFSAIGFRRSHVEEACESWAANEEETLEWLLIHVPEDDLPSSFLPENYSGGSISFATDPLSLDIKIKRLCLAGYSADVARDALLKFKEDEYRASEYLLHCLLGKNPRETFEEDLISFDDVNETTPLDQTWDDEIAAMEAIWGESRIEKINSKMIKIALEPIGKVPKLAVQVQKPIAQEYPQEIPVFTILTEHERILPAHVRLSINRKIGEYLTENFLGMEMLFSAVDWIENNVAEIINHPGRLRDVQSGVTGVFGLMDQIPKPNKNQNQNADGGGFRSRTRALNPKTLLEQHKHRLDSSEGAKMLKTRQSLPAWKLKETIAQSVSDAQVVIVGGETGSGKSTQTVQFVLDHETSSGRIANIVCTQPRRISAIGLAERVSQERCSTLGEEVGYAIRGEAKIGKDTQITFMTTGVLLRRLQSGAFGDVTHVVVDEVHERGVDTDYLLILLKRMLRKKQIKVILMSATLDVGLFSTYFSDFNVKVVNIEGRTYPVRDYYLDDVINFTNYDYHYGRGKPVDEDTQGMDSNIGATIRALGDRLDYKLLAQIVEYIDSVELKGGQDGSILVFLSGTMEITKALNEIQGLPKAHTYVALPLHASLLPSEQVRVFQSFPGKRKIICATNIAETSITISDVVAVIDTGKVKETSFDPESGLVRLAETWASRDACKQRRGRAGRVRAGKCYKLFTKNTEANRMAASSPPEMLRIPLENLVLNVKAMGIEDVKKFLKSALSPPDETAVNKAHEILKQIGAISEQLQLTGLGRHLSMIPADLRCAKLMVYGASLGILSAGVAIASIVASRSPFLSSPDKREASKVSRAAFGGGHGDLIADYRAYQEWVMMRRAKVSRRDVRAWCDENNLSHMTLNDIASNESHFLSALKEIGGFVPSERRRDGASSEEYQPMNSQSDNNSFLRAVIAAAFQPQLARIAMPDKKYAATLSGAKELDPEARTIKFFSQADWREKGGERRRVFLHPSSTLFEAQSFVNNASFLAFATQVETSKAFIRDVTPINTLTVLLFGGKLSVDSSGNFLKIGEWIKIKGWARIGVLIRILRSMIDDALQAKIADPSLDLESTEIMACVRQLIRDDGKIN